MQFPSAAAGSRKLFVGEILALIGAICTGISLMLVFFAAASVTSVENVAGMIEGAENAEQLGQAIAGAATTTVVSAGLGGLLIIAGAIVALVGLILFMVGAGQAGNDEPVFKTVLYLMIASIVLGVVGSFLRANPTIYIIINAVNKFLSLYATFLVIDGFKKLAQNMGNTTMAEKADSSFKIIACMLIISVILQVIATFVGGTIGGILTLVALVADVIWYLIYIGVLSKGKNMLNGVNA